MILQEVQTILSEQNSSIGPIDKYLPDTNFLLDSLASLDPSHRFFAKNYVAPAKPKKADKSNVL